MCVNSESENEESVEGSHHGDMAKRHKGEKDKFIGANNYIHNTFTVQYFVGALQGAPPVGFITPEGMYFICSSKHKGAKHRILDTSEEGFIIFSLL